MGSTQYEETCTLNFRSGLCDIGHDGPYILWFSTETDGGQEIYMRTVLVQVLAKCLATGIGNPLDHSVESVLGCTDRSHAVMDTTRTTDIT